MFIFIHVINKQSTKPLQILQLAPPTTALTAGKTLQCAVVVNSLYLQI